MQPEWTRVVLVVFCSCSAGDCESFSIIGCGCELFSAVTCDCELSSTLGTSVTNSSLLPVIKSYVGNKDCEACVSILEWKCTFQKNDITINRKNLVNEIIKDITFLCF